MRRGRIIHPALAGALATLGHSDIVLVVDAGFPIPRDANRIDLGFVVGQPTVPQVLRALRDELYVEGVAFAPEVRTHNPRLYEELQEIYTGAGAPFSPVTHEQLCDDVAHRAKVIIRSGDTNPWANVALTASTDPVAFFSDEQVADGLVILPAYLERLSLIHISEPTRPY